MNSIETLFLQFGLSFTMSKLLPYVLTLFLGVLVSIFLGKRLSIRAWKKWCILIVISVLPFALYFAYSPIYQGDFSNNSYTKKSNIAWPQARTLVVVVLPGCPYCKQSIETMRFLRKHADIQISYRVVNPSDSDLKYYRQKLGSGILCSAITENELKAHMNLSEGSFPTFVLAEKDRFIKAWHNDSFGVAAMDEIVGK